MWLYAHRHRDDTSRSCWDFIREIFLRANVKPHTREIRRMLLWNSFLNAKEARGWRMMALRQHDKESISVTIDLTVARYSQTKLEVVNVGWITAHEDMTSLFQKCAPPYRAGATILLWSQYIHARDIKCLYSFYVAFRRFERRSLVPLLHYALL